MNFRTQALEALSSIRPKQIASTDQQLQHAQVLALLAVSEELALLREQGALAAGSPQGS